VPCLRAPHCTDTNHEPRTTNHSELYSLILSHRLAPPLVALSFAVNCRTADIRAVSSQQPAPYHLRLPLVANCASTFDSTLCPPPQCEAAFAKARTNRHTKYTLLRFASQRLLINRHPVPRPVPRRAVVCTIKSPSGPTSTRPPRRRRRRNERVTRHNGDEATGQRQRQRRRYQTPVSIHHTHIHPHKDQSGKGTREG
jgi:hypothetical protein